MRQVLAQAKSPATATLTVVADDRNDLAAAVDAACSADVVIVLAGTIAEEGRDRPSIALANGQDSIIAAVAAANRRTIVVLRDNASTLVARAGTVHDGAHDGRPARDESSLRCLG